MSRAKLECDQGQVRRVDQGQFRVKLKNCTYKIYGCARLQVAVPIIVFPTVWQLVASINMASSDHITYIY